MDAWRKLKIDLQTETEAIFRSSGEIVLIERIGESGSELMLSGTTATLKLQHVPDRNVVRWETDKEYGFERISEPIARLATFLVKRLKSSSAPHK
jgi:hypothetical protein